MKEKIRNFLARNIMEYGKKILRRRYDVCIEGLEEIPQNAKSIILLPNHPAYLDPAIVMTHLWHYTKCRPMIYDPILNHPLVNWVKFVYQPIPVPDTRNSNNINRSQANKALEKAIDLSRKGDNLLIYPAGGLRQQGVELLGSVKGLHELIRHLPETTFIKVRTEGMWGSTSSYAWEGKQPDLGKAVLYGILMCLANGIFWMPKRKIKITLEKVKPEELEEYRKFHNREFTNRSFDDWYNKNGEEYPSYVPYHFLNNKKYNFPHINVWMDLHARMIYNNTKEEVNKLVDKYLEMQEIFPQTLNPYAQLSDVGLNMKSVLSLTQEIENMKGWEAPQIPLTLLQMYALYQGIGVIKK